MTGNEILSGASGQWRIQKLIAQGDAGELYLVESVRDGLQAVLKRPRQSAFPADTERQSHQIESEATLLKILRNLKIERGHYTVRVTGLLDHSLPGTETTSQFFVVLEKAHGVSLASLARIARLGLDEADWVLQDLPQNIRPFIHAVEHNEQIPHLLLLRAIEALLHLLETIHSWRIDWFDADIWGVLWNDVKPDHVFWDPLQTEFTIIDWGNGQLLDKSGVSQDRLYSSTDDYRQFFEELGRYISNVSPNLYTELNWSSYSHLDNDTAPELFDLKDKLVHLLQKETESYLEVRHRENYLLSNGAPSIDKLHDLAFVQSRILSYGELPDFNAAEKLHLRSASLLASQGNLREFIQVCLHVLDSIPKPNPCWKAYINLAEMVPQETGAPAGLFLDALRAAINDDWPEAHWRLCKACASQGNLQSWQKLSAQIRHLVPEIATGTQPPYLAAMRLLQGLEEEFRRQANRSVEVSEHLENSVSTKQSVLAVFEQQLRGLKNEILVKWIEMDPAPPGSDLSYVSLGKYLEDLQETLSSLGIDPVSRLSSVKQALSQPQAQATILLDAWKAKGFRTASQSLRYLLMWDPDLLRVLRADKAIQKAQDWLDEIRRGPQGKEKVMDYAIRMEHAGRLLRSHVGHALWIDTALNLFAMLRSGTRPGDLISENPTIIDDFPWLKHYERKQVPGVKQKQSTLVPQLQSHPQYIPLKKESMLGQDQDIILSEPLDTWVPEARGSSARVFLGNIRLSNGKSRQAAIKIMRPDKVDYALPLFWEEVQVLSVIGDLPGVSAWLECGFIQLDNHQTLPSETLSLNASTLTGKLIRYGTHETNDFLDELEARAETGWLPYLALEERPQEECLLLLCDEGQTKGKYLPVEIGVKMAVQICDILASAHARNVVYRDHKILHYYWDAQHQKISVIDWNVAKWHPDGLSETEILADLVQFGARALHHILTGRPAPGALPVGPTRPEEIELAPQRYLPAWTYDDSQRLSVELQNILTELLSGNYRSASKLGEDLLLQLSFGNQ
jgi:serine/threonine protein kinase